MGDLRVTVGATGSLSALNTVEVGSEVSGRIVSVLVKANDVVKKGQILAEIDPTQISAENLQSDAQVAAAQAALAQSSATENETRLALSRAEEQSTQGLIAAKELEAARAAHARANASVSSSSANVRLAQAQQRSARWKLDRTHIVSPIDGIVLTRSIEPGQTVAATFQTPVLFRLSTDLRQLSLKVNIDEADIGRVREGQSAEFRVDTYPGKAFASRVESIRNEPTTTNNVVTYEAELTVDNAERLLRPGMTATASIIIEDRKNVLLVPNAALRFSPPEPPKSGFAAGPPGPTFAKSGHTVYRLEGDRPVPISVEVGGSDGDHTELRSTDLKPGTKLVVDMLEGSGS
jgi:HlyD family secretion protein